MDAGLSLVVGGFGIGVAVSAAPGPVQAVLVSEAVRGGVGRGVRALAGASVTFVGLLVTLALGFAVSRPSGAVLHGLEVAGGALLLWLAWDGLRTGAEPTANPDGRGVLSPAVRGALAVALNPGAWLFLAAVAAPLLAAATAAGGMAVSLMVAVALAAGAALGDGVIVAVGGVGLPRADERVRLWVMRVFALFLAGLGVWLLVQGAGALAAGTT